MDRSTISQLTRINLESSSMGVPLPISAKSSFLLLAKPRMTKNDFTELVKLVAIKSHRWRWRGADLVARGLGLSHTELAGDSHSGTGRFTGPAGANKRISCCISTGYVAPHDDSECMLGNAPGPANTSSKHPNEAWDRKYNSNQIWCACKHTVLHRLPRHAAGDG